METIEKQPDNKNHDEPVRADRWTIIWFMADGKTWSQKTSYETKQKAYSVGNEVIKTARSYPPERYMSRNDHKKLGAKYPTYKNKDLSHFIPMPVKD